MTTGYEARLHRIGRWWAVDIPRVAVHTQCRTLDEAEDMARDAIAEGLGVRPDTITVQLVVPEFAPLLRGVREARTHRAAEALADAARTLVEDLGVSERDTGRLLGLSHQQMSRFCLTRRTATGSRPWDRAPLSAPGTPGPVVHDLGDTAATHPNGRRRPAPSRPAWAIAEDDG